MNDLKNNPGNGSGTPSGPPLKDRSVNKNSVLIVMIIVIASPFIFHLQESPEKVSIAALLGTLSLSCLASGGFTQWYARMKTPSFAAFWIFIWVLSAAAPFIALKLG